MYASVGGLLSTYSEPAQMGLGELEKERAPCSWKENDSRAKRGIGAKKM